MLASANCTNSRLKQELTLSAPVERGESKKGRLVQELLVINGIKVGIDGDVGDATEEGLRQFCRREGLLVQTSVDQSLLDRLAQPLLRAVVPTQAAASLGETVVAVARQHLAEHPIEVGKPNSGPWVRLYMKGSEGKDFLWCAGFVSYVVAAASKAHGTASPITSTFSCDQLAAEAQGKRTFVKRVSPSEAPPGSLFLVPHASNRNDWVHTGIVTGGTGKAFHTIEGNTNDDGSREGFEVCARIRACHKVDVVLL